MSTKKPEKGKEKGASHAPAGLKLPEKDRGTTNEMEVLMLILKENMPLRLRIMERLRVYRQDVNKRKAAGGKKEDKAS